MTDRPSRVELLFVYNADTGLFNTVADAAHKILSPSTYSCNLCKVTYGDQFGNFYFSDHRFGRPLEAVLLLFGFLFRTQRLAQLGVVVVRSNPR